MKNIPHKREKIIMEPLDNTINIEIEECCPSNEPECPFYNTLDGSYYTEWCSHPLLYNDNFKILNSKDYMTIKLPESCPLISNPVTVYRKE